MNGPAADVVPIVRLNDLPLPLPVSIRGIYQRFSLIWDDNSAASAGVNVVENVIDFTVHPLGDARLTVVAR